MEKWTENFLPTTNHIEPTSTTVANQGQDFFTNLRYTTFVFLCKRPSGKKRSTDCNTFSVKTQQWSNSDRENEFMVEKNTEHSPPRCFIFMWVFYTFPAEKLVSLECSSLATPRHTTPRPRKGEKTLPGELYSSSADAPLSLHLSPLTATPSFSHSLKSRFSLLPSCLPSPSFLSFTASLLPISLVSSHFFHSLLIPTYTYPPIPLILLLYWLTPHGIFLPSFFTFFLTLLFFFSPFLLFSLLTVSFLTHKI